MQENKNPVYLDKNDLRVLEMKYEGKTYQEMADETGISYSSISKWFKGEGRLFGIYQKYAIEQNQLRREAALQILKKNLAKAANKIVELIDSKNQAIAGTYAKELLDRELGRPVQPVLQGELGRSYIDQWKHGIGIDEAVLGDPSLHEEGTGSLPEVDVYNLREDILPLPIGDSREDISSLLGGPEEGASPGNSD